MVDNADILHIGKEMDTQESNGNPYSMALQSLNDMPVNQMPGTEYTIGNWADTPNCRPPTAMMSISRHGKPRQTPI